MTTEALQHKELIIIGLSILGFILMMMRGGKLSLFGQTVEVPVGGKKQKIDTIGLMYLMKDACEHIELLRKERAVRSLVVCIERRQSLINDCIKTVSKT